MRVGREVFQFGDALAIVCADTPEQAKAAAEKVKVELEVLPAYMSAPAAMADDAIEIHPGTPNVYYGQTIAKGAETGPLSEVVVPILSSVAVTPGVACA